MIAILDYGVGNLFSIRRSLDALGLASEVTRDAQAVEAADGLILPGVGAFGDAADKLRASGLADVLLRRAKAGAPLLGICLGMQLLFERSYEYGTHEGLALIPGEICPMQPDLTRPLKVPEIGWNALRVVQDCPLLRDVRDGDCVYYVHSYYAKRCEPYVAADSEYDVRVPGLVQKGRVFGAQFHPEKSGGVGLSILRAFGDVVKGGLTC